MRAIVYGMICLMIFGLVACGKKGSKKQLVSRKSTGGGEKVVEKQTKDRLQAVIDAYEALEKSDRKKNIKDQVPEIRDIFNEVLKPNSDKDTQTGDGDETASKNWVEESKGMAGSIEKVEIKSSSGNGISLALKAVGDSDTLTLKPMQTLAAKKEGEEEKELKSIYICLFDSNCKDLVILVVNTQSQAIIPLYYRYEKVTKKEGKVRKIILPGLTVNGLEQGLEEKLEDENLKKSDIGQLIHSIEINYHVNVITSQGLANSNAKIDGESDEISEKVDIGDFDDLNTKTLSIEEKSDDTEEGDEDEE